MARVYVGVGSNIDPVVNIRSGLTALRSSFHPLTVSPAYRSRAVGFEGEDFHNLVVGFDTELPVTELAETLRAIEMRHGRAGEKGFVPRTLDLDLLLYDDLIVESGRVKLPRADILRYAHVLKPLADIAGEQRHPLLGRCYAELWADFEARNSGGTLSRVLTAATDQAD
jgi:2-amino-4-hydroxy-6-hydroxymethyldihydropteridine diphosphokinase